MSLNTDLYQNIVDSIDHAMHEANMRIDATTKDLLIQDLLIRLSARDEQLWLHAYNLGKRDIYGEKTTRESNRS